MVKQCSLESSQDPAKLLVPSTFVATSVFYPRLDLKLSGDKLVSIAGVPEIPGPHQISYISRTYVKFMQTPQVSIQLHEA